jgi:hypothetical protein
MAPVAATSANFVLRSRRNIGLGATTMGIMMVTTGTAVIIRRG